MSFKQSEERVRKNSLGYGSSKKRSKTKQLLSQLKDEMNDGGVSEELEETLNKHFATLRRLRAKN